MRGWQKQWRKPEAEGKRKCRAEGPQHCIGLGGKASLRFEQSSQRGEEGMSNGRLGGTFQAKGTSKAQGACLACGRECREAQEAGEE